MACNSSSFEITRPVMSTGSDSVDVFHVFKRIRIGKAQKVRVSLLMDGSTGNLLASAAGRSANTVEGLDSATAAALPGQASLSSDGESYGQGFAMLDTDYQWVDIGVFGTNVATTSGRQLALVTAIIEIQDC